ncbi:hypothetical protein G9A89_001396 [Geosiphon pyriformis]|nr:hypothetical protein G9A89_001396 [Geosiphon pyriformis]
MRNQLPSSSGQSHPMGLEFQAPAPTGDQHVQPMEDITEDDAFEINLVGPSNYKQVEKTSGAKEKRSSTRLKRKAQDISKLSFSSKEKKAKKAAPLKKRGSLRYIIKEEEIEETEKFELVGEDPEEEEPEQEKEDNFLWIQTKKRHDSLPCRYFDDFVVYDIANKNTIVSLDIFDEEGVELRASGVVRPMYIDGHESELHDDDDDDDDDDGNHHKNSDNDNIRVNLSTIFYYQIEYNQNGRSEIWLRTQFAWYLLVQPSEQYIPHFIPLFKKVRLSNLIIKAMATDHNMDSTKFKEFLKSATDNSLSSITSELESSIVLTEQDISDNILHICGEIEVWLDEQNDFELLEGPFFKYLQDLRAKKSGNKSFYSNLDTQGKKTKRNIDVKNRNQNLAVLRHTNPTCVTPFIQNLTKGLFVRELVIVPQVKEATQHLEHLSVSDPAVEVTKETTEVVAWIGEKITHNSRSYYRSVKIDDEVINIGDSVYLRNEDSEESWVAKIMYMWEDKKERKQFHSRFFHRGKDTILKELAGPRELFLLDSCDDNPLNSIIGKANVKRIDPSQNDEIKLGESNDYFYRFWYDEKRPSFVDARLNECENSKFIYCDQYQQCHSCEDQLASNHSQKPHWILPEDPTLGFIYKLQEYRQYDFVYIIPEDNESSLPYDIAQIIQIINDVPFPMRSEEHKFKSSKKSQNLNKTKNIIVDSEAPAKVKLLVQYLYRYDEIIEAKYSKNKNSSVIVHAMKDVKDSRKLVFTSELKSLNVEKLEGICWVEHRHNISDLDAYKNERDTFYVESQTMKRAKVPVLQPISPDDIQINETSRIKRNEYAKKMSNFLEHIQSERKKLRAMDIFSGCGGITVGMEKTGIIDTRWAIEFSPSAALTFSKNNPHSTVYNQCANLLLERAIAEHGRKEKLPSIEDLSGKPIMTSMPAPGDVDFIYCGPPCQGFSGVNRFKKADDIKNSLVATALSYVDFYRPDYFLLENVRGMLMYKFGGEQDGKTKIKGGITMGVVKFILRALTAMGYQTRFSVQQAGNHEVPQTRRRLFIWGAKIGSNLPNFPQPSSCFGQRASISIPIPDGESFHYNFRTNGHAPHRSITVGDAINDLPEFEYVNPHEVYPETEEDRKAKPKWDQLVVPVRGWVGEPCRDYDSQPLTEFQRRCRQIADRLYNHVTRIFTPLNVERIYDIPLTPGADHHQLRPKLQVWCLVDPKSAASRHGGWKGLYGRLDFNGHFATALTDVNPMGKTGTVLHPNQRRILTVRECARAQGFPDHFIFYSDRDDIKDLHRQIGNAVPPPLAFALGELLVKALFEKYEENLLNSTSSYKGKGKAY